MPSEPFTVHDVVIVGAGVVGCAVAAALSRYDLRVAVVEREYDVGEGTSKANSAILHTGFDAPVGSVEAALVVEGHRLWDEIGPELHVPIQRIGAMLVALDDAEVQTLEALRETGRRNGVLDLALLSRDKVLAAEPYITPAVRAALVVPQESITDPFAAVIALAEHAAQNGVGFHFGCTVERIARGASAFDVVTTGGTYRARWVVNAAGLHSDEVARLAGRAGVAVRPRKGEFLIFDKAARRLVSHIVLPVPTKISKGILVTPTVFGNVLAGPTATDQQDKHDKTVTDDGLQRVRQGMRKLVPALEQEVVIATYAGLRAVGSTGDYLLDVDGDARLVTISGVRSTGLTSAPAIARRVVGGMAGAGLQLRERAGFHPGRPHPAWIAGEPRPCADPARVARDPAFGRVVCLCESTSEAEVVAALRAQVPAATLDAVKKRTWATAGRCQGYFCTAALLEIMARELGVAPWAVRRGGPGSEVVAGAIRVREGVA